MKMPAIKYIIYSIISICIGMLITFVFLEVVFRILPTSDSFNMLAVNDENPIARASPNRDINLSNGWNFRTAVRKHVNNFGFLNDQNYSEADTSLLLAVIGDSYVEAGQVENSKAMHGLLSGSTPHPKRIYSFGVPGAPLSQYLMEARYAVERFGADFLVIIVVGNDFDESLIKYKQAPEHHYFVEDDNGSYSLIRVDYMPSRLNRIAKHSAFLRYIFINLRLDRRMFGGWFSVRQADAPGNFVGNTSAYADEDRIIDSRKVVDEFLRRLSSETGISTERILIVVDGIRPQMYEADQLERTVNTYFWLMRNYLLSAAEAHCIETIDMQSAFLEDFTRRKVRFEDPADGHWNEVGHAIVAREIAATNVYRRFLASSNPSRKKAAADDNTMSVNSENLKSNLDSECEPHQDFARSAGATRIDD